MGTTDIKSQLLDDEVKGQESPQTPTKKLKKKRRRERERENINGSTVQVQNEQPSIGDESNDQLHVADKSNEPRPMNVKVEVIYDRTDKTTPIVGYFPSGYNPLKKKDGNNLEQADQEPNLLPPSVRFYRNAQRVKIEKSSEEKNEKWKSSERLELVVKPNGSNVEFVGKSYKGEAMAAQLCTYALGVLDKETQTLKIMPIAGNKILRLEPKVRGLDIAEKEPSDLENAEPSGEQRAGMRETLTILYGSKKSITQAKKLHALNQEDDPESQKDLGKKIDYVPVNKEALESTSAHIARNIPPHNTSAITPQEAYPLDKIILTGEWDFLEDIDEALRVGAEVTSNAYPTFVCNRIQKRQDFQDEVEKKTLSHVFSYITHLIKFKDLHSIDGMSSAKNHRIPSILRQKFVDMFAPERRRLPDDKLNLLISYVLVLTLHADDFRSNLADIAKDLRMGPVTLRKHFENLGCKLVHESKSLVATLPVPLQFPKLRQKRRR